MLLVITFHNYTLVWGLRDHDPNCLSLFYLFSFRSHFVSNVNMYFVVIHVRDFVPILTLPRCRALPSAYLGPLGSESITTQRLGQHVGDLVFSMYVKHRDLSSIDQVAEVMILDV